MPYRIFAETPRPPIEVRKESSTGGRKIIFLLRQNPQKTGGVQRLNRILVEGLSPFYSIETVNWKGPMWAAPIYFPIFYWKTRLSDGELVYCDDMVTSLIGAKIRRIGKKKVVTAAHGLDLILPIPWYQKKLRKASGTLDKIITISRATANQLIERGIPPDKIVIIAPAAESVPERAPRNEALYSRLEKDIGVNLRHKKVLISIGRPVRRKGFDRFIVDVFHHLPEDFVYIVAGPRLKTPPWIRIAKPILGKKLYRNLLLASGSYSMHDDLVRLSSHPRVFYINGVSEELRDMIYAAADLFIMPNITVEGDMEGFGLVALEAAIRGVPVVATGIEGITDAVIDGENGVCVPEGDSGAMLKAIVSLLEDPLKFAAFSNKAREFTADRFDRNKTFGRYREVFDALLPDRIPLEKEPR